MTRPAISYQLYSSRNFPDLARQAKMLGDLGIRHAEPFGGLFGDLPALQGALAANGLTAPTAHVGAPTWREDFDGVMQKLQALGVQTAIMPAVPPAERVQDIDGWKKVGQELAGYARRVADHGMAFAWHNHHFEFARLPDGSFPLEWILGEDPALQWQCDIAWVLRGGQNPIDWIGKYRDRIVSYHIKDLAPEGECAAEDGWADVGHGVIDWASLRPELEHAAVWTLEHDNPSDDQRFARRSFETVKGW